MKTILLIIVISVSFLGTSQNNLTSFGSKNFAYIKASHFNKLLSNRVEGTMGLGLGYQRLMKYNLMLDLGLTTTTFDAYAGNNFSPLDYQQLTTRLFMRDLEVDAQLFWFPSWGSNSAPFGFYLGGGAFFSKVKYIDDSEVETVYLYDPGLDDYLRADHLQMTIAPESGFNIIGINSTAGYRLVLSPIFSIDVFANFKPILLVGNIESLEIEAIEQVPSSSNATYDIKDSWSYRADLRMDEIFTWDFGVKLGVSLFRKKVK